MLAKQLSDLLQKGDRVAVSNITGREASKVSVVSQLYCDNIVAGWALGKAGQMIDVPGREPIPVFGQFDEMMAALPPERKPNKVIVYSPPDAVYGDVKEVIEHGKGIVETIYVITEHVSVEVTAKLRRLCDLEGVDIIGCNTLGLINAHDQVRVGAVGGDSPAESFLPGSASIISNSGNMVNTIASYLQSAGLGISYGISTGKDTLILTPLKDLIFLAEKDPRTRIIVLYVEPGGTYERRCPGLDARAGFSKPMLVYVAGLVRRGPRHLAGPRRSGGRRPWHVGQREDGAVRRLLRPATVPSGNGSRRPRRNCGRRGGGCGSTPCTSWCRPPRP